MVLLSGAKPEGFQIRLCVNLECRHLPGHFWGHALSAHVCDSITLEFIWFCNSSIEKQKATAHLKGILDVSLWLHTRSILKAIYPSNPICLNPPKSQTDHWLIFTQQLGLDFLHFQSSLWKFETEHTQNAQLHLYSGIPFCCYLAKGSKAFWRSHFSTGPCGITLCPWEKSVITLHWKNTPRGMSEM